MPTGEDEELHVQLPPEVRKVIESGVQDMWVDVVPAMKEVAGTGSVHLWCNRVSYNVDYHLSGSSNSIEPGGKDSTIGRFLARRVATKKGRLLLTDGADLMGNLD